MNKLLDYYEGDNERVGFILKSGEIVEVENVAEDPTCGFDVRPEDLIKYEDEAVATWHTHPGKDANLSLEDMEAFVSWPDWIHYIVGERDVRAYVVKNGMVVHSQVK